MINDALCRMPHSNLLTKTQNPLIDQCHNLPRTRKNETTIFHGPVVNLLFMCISTEPFSGKIIFALRL
ncbi:MAG: hypothetical protein CVV34_02590 [Methanomicrobiales archaeon HGW-Methanomicrobiales-5]|nr:MAG: hypothetical protein CVV34_02590 [Methanomicrobiales archaeon HGW-Methanomicrobiales-5]